MGETLVADLHRAASDRLAAENRLGDLGTAGPDHAGKSDDLSPPDLEADSLDPIPR